MPTWPRRSDRVDFNGELCQPCGSNSVDLSAATRPSSAASRTEDLGLVSETKEEHLARHRSNAKNCPRCRFYKFGDSWKQAYGYVSTSSRAGPGRRVAWLAERPARWEGTWALGCVMCSDFSARQTCEGNGNFSRRGNTAWARFAVRASALQAEHVRQHQNYEVHRMAVRAWLRPDAPLQLNLSMAWEDAALLNKDVPQPDDWMLRWNIMDRLDFSKFYYLKVFVAWHLLRGGPAK